MISEVILMSDTIEDDQSVYIVPLIGVDTPVVRNSPYYCEGVFLVDTDFLDISVSPTSPFLW